VQGNHTPWSENVKVVITIETVPKKLLEIYKDDPPPEGIVPRGVSLVPKKRDGAQKIQVYIQEKMSQYRTRVAIAHELFHCLQYLTNCEQDEKSADNADETMVLLLKEKKKVRNAKSNGRSIEKSGG
jgi:hypothetical protein